LNHLTLIGDCGGNSGWRLGAVIHALATDPDEPLQIDRAYSGRQRMATYWLAKEAPGDRQGRLAL